MRTDTKPNSTLKTVKVVVLIATFFIQSVMDEALFWFFRSPERAKHAARARKLARYCRKMLKILGIRFREPPPTEMLDPGLIICNHLSYVDVFVLAATTPSLFVTSVEVRNQSWIGTICKIAGCLFVERRSRKDLQSEIRAIDWALTLGTSVVVFPEATSTSGETVLPFKAALYQAAIDARVPIHHFFIKYEQPEIAYYGDMTMEAHLKRLISLEEIPVTVKFVGTFEEPHPPLRHEIAQKSYQLVQNAYLSH